MKLCALSFGVLASFFAQAAQSIELENDKISVAFDENGNLVSLKNLAANKDFAGGQNLFRIICEDGLIQEREVFPDGKITVSKTADNRAEISYGGEFPVKIICTIDGDELRLDAEITNASKSKILREFQFPMIKNVQLSPKNRLIMNSEGGELFPSALAYAASKHTGYKSQDNKAVERYGKYPREVSMNFYVVEDDGCSLYIACEDARFDLTLHLLRQRRDGYKPLFLDLAMSKFPYLKPGESQTLPTFVLSPHVGDWHVSGKKYRKWADTWYKKMPAVKSVMEMNGWQRVILRQQYGTVLFPYSDFEKICKAGLDCGINSLLMFGWWKEGMDAGYPDYTADDTQGGDDALRESIKKFRAMGGNVMVYFNGQLIDVSTKYFKERGQYICDKTSAGMPHLESYPFGSDGTGLKALGNKEFGTACHAVPEWFDMLKSYVDRAISLGANGVFLDQMGGGSIQTCFDASHGHKVPFTDAMYYKAEILRKVRDYIKSKNPDISLGVERATDCTSQYVDYIHTCGFGYNYAEKDKETGRPILKSVPTFRYVFPEAKISDRGIRDDTDIERRVNICLLWGLLSDVEIYRCREIIDAAPNYKKYLAEADRLRDKYRRLIMNGTFSDTDYAVCSSKRLDYTVFVAGDEMAVVATNAYLDGESAEFSIEGYKFAEADGISAFNASAEGDKGRVELKRKALAVLIFKKK